MSEFMKTQNSFANGEVAAEFYAHDNLNGLAKLENMDVTAGGGLCRRRGLASVATLGATGRLIPFSVSESENYILVLTNGHLLVYNGTTRVRDLFMPWDSDDIDKIQYAQRFGTMIFVHPNYQPYILKKTDTTFNLSLFEFARNDSDMTINIPFMRFDDSEKIKITLTSNSSGANYVTCTTNYEFWTPDCVGTRLLFLGRQWRITEYVSPTVVYAYTNGQYTLPQDAISDWYESAFSAHRGWPCSITFHQDRLVFGGTPSWPSGIWMSCVGRHNNFNVGTGLDDEAIFITLLSQQRQQICTVVSSDNLQILTNSGEWAISSKPLTPSSVDIKQHTSVGSVASRYLPPQKIEGATVFISATQRDIRELSLDALGENYNARDLCATAKHLMNTPVDISYNEPQRQLFVVMASGEMAVLNQNSGLGISGWARYTTNGQFKSVATSGGVTYVVVARNNGFYLEYFSSDALRDANQYDFSFTASAMPVRASSHNVASIRVRKITARVFNTKTLFINGIRTTLPNSVYVDDSPGYSGDVSVNLLGTNHNGTDAPWTISSNEQLPCNVLSICMHGYYNV